MIRIYSFPFSTISYARLILYFKRFRSTRSFRYLKFSSRVCPTRIQWWIALLKKKNITEVYISHWTVGASSVWKLLMRCRNNTLGPSNWDIANILLIRVMFRSSEAGWGGGGSRGFWCRNGLWRSRVSSRDRFFDSRPCFGKVYFIWVKRGQPSTQFNDNNYVQKK